MRTVHEFDTLSLGEGEGTIVRCGVTMSSFFADAEVVRPGADVAAEGCWGSIAAAVAVVVEGNGVIVTPGTYTETAIALDRDIFIQGFGTDAIVEGDAPIFTTTASVSISGLTLRSLSPTTRALIESVGDLRISDIAFEDEAVAIERRPAASSICRRR